MLLKQAELEVTVVMKATVEQANSSNNGIEILGTGLIVEVARDQEVGGSYKGHSH